MAKKFRKLGILAFALAQILVLIGTKTVFAEETLEGLHIQMSPLIQRTELDPGQIYENNLTVTNTGSEPVKYKMVVQPYAVEDINYAPIYSVKNAYTQIVDWISFDKEQEEGILEPNISTVIDYKITVPDDAPGGGQYAVIFVEISESDKDSIQASARAGLIVAARLNGTTRMTGEIINTFIPGFLLAPPVSATATFKNTGNVDADAKMSIKIEKYFTGEIVYDGTNDPLEKTVFPDTTRDLNISWANVPRLGIFKVTLNTEFMGDAEVKTRIVIICPIWFMAIIILIILVIVFRILAKRREDRRTRTNSRNAQGSSGNLNL